MSGVLSTLGEATGLKPSDQVIALNKWSAAKAKAMAYCQACLATASQDLRHILVKNLADELGEYERMCTMMEGKGWYPLHGNLDVIVQSAVALAEPGVQT